MTVNADPNLDIIQFWKSSIIADIITFIKAIMDEFYPESTNLVGITNERSCE